jgi:FkbM family methyltransferase
VEPHTAGGVGRLGKRIAPALAHVVNMKGMRDPARLIGIYLDILQGKGSGTGWDLAGEVSAALAFLEGIPDPIIFDIGANHGDWALGIWRALGHGRYFAYEPQESCLSDLMDISIPNLTITQKAVSDQGGEINLYSDKAGSGLASFYERYESHLPAATRVERVPVTTIDKELEAHRLDHVDFMKIDVEGAELQVLRGAERSLHAKAIHAFAFEFGAVNIVSRVFFRDCWDLITGHGYSLWRIAPGGQLIPLHTYREDLEHFRGVSNYVASVISPNENRQRRSRSRGLPMSSKAQVTVS